MPNNSHIHHITLQSEEISSLLNINLQSFEKFSLSEDIRYVIERILTFFVIILISPIMLFIAAIIKITTLSDILYTQVRVGKDGKEFKIIKFCTMVKNAESQSGPVLAIKNDNRVTKIGNILRKSHLDELPQLFNVLKGEMSIIGPRPERPIFVNQFNKEIDHYRDREDVRPGITGLAQICLPYDATGEEKLKYDLYYINFKESIVLNCTITIYTIKKMLLLNNYVGLSEGQKKELRTL